MAIVLDEIRTLATRVAASHHLEIVDVEFSGGAKFRSLRVFLEKNEAERAKLKEAGGMHDLPSGVPAEMLSGVTHEDCVAFAQDFGAVLDVEELIPGAEYTLEVSSPGLERKLTKPEEYVRFSGCLVKLQTFTPIEGNRHWTGRLNGCRDGVMALDAMPDKSKSKGKKAAKSKVIEIALSNIERANLVAEI